MSKSFNLALTLLCFINLLSPYVSCSIINFEELKISSNIDKDEIYFDKDFISITFSISPSKSLTEKIISLKENDYKTDLDFKWNQTGCEIKPQTGFKKNAVYDFKISGTLQTEDNRNYEIDYSRIFTYGTDNDRFCLTAYTNPDETAQNKNLILSFNKPVDIPSFEDNFSLNPYIKISKKYSDDYKTITIIPEDIWAVNTYYTWLIKSIDSTEGYRTDKEYTRTFYYSHDYTLPQLLSSNLNDRKITDPLSFTFNKKINLESFENYFSISPYIKGYYTQNETTVTFHPLSNFEINKQYTINLPSKICDENKLCLYSDIYKTFTPVNQFLTISSVSINEAQNISLSDESISEIDITNTDSFFIEIIFSSPIKKENLTSAEKAIQMEPFFPASSSYPKLTSATWNIERTKLNLTYSNISKTYNNQIYKITISNSKTYFLTENEEYMEKEICIHFLAKQN